MISETDAQVYVNRLADEIAKEVNNPAVTAAFRAVPRHLFVRHGFQMFDQESRQMKHYSRETTEPEEWLKVIYENRVLTIEQGNSPSSSSEPVLMAQMLTDLDVKEGMRVLEIGTGTGYNAALLAELVGESGEVVSIDNQAHLVEAASEILREMYGDQIKLRIGDGYLGVPELAAYDRIIATANPPRVPPAWIEQLRMGGKILANVGHGGGLLVLERSEDRVAGHFLEQVGFFMPLLDKEDLTEDWIDTLDLQSLDSFDFRFFMGWLAPDVYYHLMKNNSKQGEEFSVEFRSSDGKTLVRLEEIEQRGKFIKLRGDDAFLDKVVATVERWHDFGKPRRSDFVVTIEEDGRQVLRLNSMPLTEL